MRFVWFFEFSPEYAEDISARNKQLDQEMEKNPEHYPRLHPSYMTGLCKGFRMIEADSDEQLIRLAMHFHPHENWEFTPVFEGAKVSEIWRKMKE
jgi:hypothetical protein